MHVVTFCTLGDADFLKDVNEGLFIEQASIHKTILRSDQLNVTRRLSKWSPRKSAQLLKSWKSSAMLDTRQFTKTTVQNGMKPVLSKVHSFYRNWFFFYLIKTFRTSIKLEIKCKSYNINLYMLMITVLVVLIICIKV